MGDGRINPGSTVDPGHLILGKIQGLDAFVDCEYQLWDSLKRQNGKLGFLVSSWSNFRV
jgi:hypothetical protein